MDINPKNLSDNSYDDLTAIKGIGQTRQQWLRDSFNVRTFHDLAVLSADAIEAKLKAEKQIPSRSHIERWLSEAKQFAEDPELVTITKVRLSLKKDGWKPFASFVVEFQEHDISMAEVRTRVHYIEGDETRTWTGVVQQELCQWITQQLGDKAKNTIVKTELEKVIPFSESPTGAPETSIAPKATSINSPAPTQNNQLGFSDQLQQMLAKTGLASRPIVQLSTMISSQPPTQANMATPAKNLMLMAEAPSRSTKEYSVKLQQLIAKAQRLSSTRS